MIPNNQNNPNNPSGHHPRRDFSTNKNQARPPEKRHFVASSNDAPTPTFSVNRLVRHKNNLPPRRPIVSHDRPAPQPAIQAINRPGPRPTIRRGTEKRRRPATDHDEATTKPKEKIPEISAGVIRVIPLGGVEEIGKNMTAIEIGNDLIVIDAGLAFPGEDAPGVDYIIPDTTYVEERKGKVRGLLITHGHLDHIGGIPYIMDKIGNPPIYTSLLTAVMIKKRQEEFPHLAKLNIQIVNPGEKLKLGEMRFRFFATSHTIPDSIGIILDTPYGNIIATGDIRIEHQEGVPADFEAKT